MANTFDYDVFISYCSADKEWVRNELLTRLRDNGLHVCIDTEFQVGASSVKEMERAIVTSAKTILVLTPNYLKSAWTEFEALMLQTLSPANQQLRLLPLLKEKCQLPLRYQYLVHVDFTDSADLDPTWSRLLNAIKPDLVAPSLQSNLRVSDDQRKMLLQLRQEQIKPFAQFFRAWLDDPERFCRIKGNKREVEFPQGSIERIQDEEFRNRVRHFVGLIAEYYEMCDPRSYRIPGTSLNPDKKLQEIIDMYPQLEKDIEIYCTEV